MKRLIYLFAIAPAIANAETFTIDTKVTEVTVYPESAEVIRTGAFNVPAGQHRLILLGIPASDPSAQSATMNVQAAGLRQTSVLRRFENVPWQDYQTDAERQAEARVEEIEMKIDAVQDAADVARLKSKAAEQTLSFLGDLGRNEGLADADVQELRSIARMIGDESLQAELTAHAAQIEARTIEDQLADLQEQLLAAQTDLNALVPETDDRMFVAVDVVADEPTEGELTLSYLDSYGVEWQPGYEFRLTTGDAPEVRIDRTALIMQETGENWTDITLHLSTLQPTGQNSASRLYAIRQSIVDERAEPLLEAPVVFEETQPALPKTSSVEGTGVTYTLPDPVSISTGLAFAEFSIDRRTQSAEIFAQATPRRDSTAYRTARFTNPWDQNLLDSGLVKWFVDDVLVAAGGTEEIGPSEEVEMGFGPLYGLTIKRDILDRSSGDTGLIARSNQNVERALIQIENRTDRSWPVRILDQVPYSEQDDLEISWTAKPRPNEENIENKRGILAWDVDLAPGQIERIELNTTLNWPEGMVLD